MHALTCALLLVATATVCNAALVSLSAGQKQGILDAHNRLRAQTASGRTPGQPRAVRIPALKWDDRLMRSASRWVQQCSVGHDSSSARAMSGFTWVGQNWAGGHSSDFRTYVKMWFDEYKDYNYRTKSCKSVCGHYTQVVWAKTTLVGCAAARCRKYPFHFVCNYAPGGNFNNEAPYVAARH